MIHTMNQKINDKGDRVSHSRFNTRAQMSRSNFQLMIAEIQDPIFDGLSDICVQFLKGSSDMCARVQISTTSLHLFRIVF